MSSAKLTVSEQIDYMKSKGITFNLMSEVEAEEYLKYNNYFFKLKAYARNYDRYKTGDKKGQYINLDFVYLKELSILDMYFRQIIMELTLVTEHFLKVRLIRECTENADEDGYKIVRELFNRYPYIQDNIDRNQRHSACSGLISKYNDYFAVWNLVEVLSFGDFIQLYKLYYDIYPDKQKIKGYFLPIKFLRNAAAHNNCLLNNLGKSTEQEYTINKNIRNKIAGIPTVSKGTISTQLESRVIHDLVILLYVFDQVVTSETTKNKTLSKLKKLLDERAVRNKTYFEKNALILSRYTFLKKIVDYYCVDDVN